MKRFYTNNITVSHAILSGKEKEHCIKVLRTKEGEQIEIVDGKGNLYQGLLNSSSKNEAVVEIVSKIDTQKQPNNHLTIASCIPKNSSRWEWLLEKATEIGVNEIIPLLTHRSEKSRIRRDRNEQIILSAFKQSGQLFLPKLLEPVKFNSFVQDHLLENGLKLIAHCEYGPKRHLADEYEKGKGTIILIGPEGDFTKEEIILAKENGYISVSLGESRLRVETAGVMAAGIVSWINTI